MLKEKTVFNIKKAIHRAFNVLGGEFQYSVLDTSNTQSNVYGESVNKQYLAPSILTLNALRKNLKGSDLMIEELTFEVPIYDLEQSNLSTDPLELVKGKVTFEGNDYTLVKVEPVKYLSGVNMSLKFTCEQRLSHV